MSNEAIAFLTGLFGSVHCVAMCGPLVMSLSLNDNSWAGLSQKLVYQLGRILTYSVFGFLAGVVGSGFNILGLQQLLSLTTGILLITIALYHFSGRTVKRFDKLQYRVVAPIASRMTRWLSKPYGGLFAGALNGLLPCGMVYMAIAASLNAGTPLAGSRFMFFFGLGTSPLLLFASMTPLFFKRFRAWKLLIPALFLAAGSFLVFRSLNMQIPYISSSVIINNTAPVCK